MCLDFCTCTWKAQMCRYSLIDCNFTCVNESTHFVGYRKEVPSEVHVGGSRKAENLQKETLSLQVPARSQLNNTHWDLTSITIDTNGFTPSQDISVTFGKKKQHKGFNCISDKLRKHWVTFPISELKGSSEDFIHIQTRGAPMRLFKYTQSCKMELK